MSKNRFLDLVGLHLRENRPKVKSLDYIVWTKRGLSRTFVQIWFRTRGCRHSHRGGCTMCDYWASDPVFPEQMVASVEEALDTLDFEPSVLVLNASGSVFDDWEVPQEARRKIFQLLSRFRETVFVLETHADTISEDKIVECTDILDNRQVYVEMGLESADPWILEHCVNKALEPQDIIDAIQILKKCHVGSIVNILIGIPFLTVSEMVEEAILSTNWAFDQGADSCVLFPVNIKPWTLVYWLEEFGLYTQPSLWTLVEVMSRLDPELLPCIDISWYKTLSQPHPEYTIPIRGPTTCPECHDAVIDLLDSYVFSDDRGKIVKRLVGLQCRCKAIWRVQLESRPTLTAGERVQLAYQVIGEQILGRQWWTQHGDGLLADIPDHVVATAYSRYSRAKP